ncbi:hypothetical protein PR002_g27059 [Phytophthora rubi]|uniref:Reverse transcriptase domain-containing protein n=1 Tax=Phytophthora rubi TaxID=129364 RepID=A0A6A3HR05_9STRA|nr:hypothetical protein PR002_g27059 [Phytophthora rubi]
MAGALALLLDFRKAYDSVDREFLYEALLWLGFPVDYVTAMRGLHDGTRVRFLANGYRSRWVAVTCGIRQGCPLAPLLFIIVLDAMYRRIDNEPKVSGIVLKSQAGSMRLKVGGYADDTASYVSTIAEVVIIMGITRVFALASGLMLNEAKTLVIALNPAAIVTMGPLPAPLKLQPVHKLARYLGLQVGSLPDPDYTWRLARTQLVTRLALAMGKTLTVDQRSLLAMAIVIPKLLYIGRHQWPSRETTHSFQKMITNFVWHGRFTEEDVGGRAWLNVHVASLTRHQGGLAVPDLKVELLALAAVTVNIWAIDADPSPQIVGDVLTGPLVDGVAPSVYVSPRHTPPTTYGKRLKDSIWTTGINVCNTYGEVTPPEHKGYMVIALACLLHFRGPLGQRWYGRRLMLDTQPLQGTVCRQYVATEAAIHGSFCSDWVPFLTIADLKLYSAVGTVMNIKSKFRTLCRAGTALKDILHWR